MNLATRRSVLAAAPTFAAAAALASLAGTAEAKEASPKEFPNTCKASSGAFASVSDLEVAFEEFGALSDEEIQSMIVYVGDGEYYIKKSRIPLPGPAAIVSCVLSAAWIFRHGTSKNRIIGQLTDTVMSCVGIPLGTAVTLKVARLIWTHRQKIIAALSVIGLTAGQLAPLKNAPYPR